VPPAEQINGRGRPRMIAAFRPTVPTLTTPASAWLAVAVAASIVFTVAPGVDLWVAALFYDGFGFPAAEWPVLTFLRRLFWASMAAMLLIALAGVAVGAILGSFMWVPMRLRTLVVGIYALGPGLIVDLGLKSH
jgi:hypothetical protein